MSMGGHFTWWANRKSRMGLQASAKKPPHIHGREWWTTPPVSAPEPCHLEYAVEFFQELQRRRRTAEVVSLIANVSAWIRTARRLLHERIESDDGDLHTTDGLIIAADRAMKRLRAFAVSNGMTSDELEKLNDVMNAVRSRADKARRERATRP